MEGKACIMTSDFSSPKTVASVLRYHMVCLGTRTRSGQIAWPSRRGCITCGYVLSHASLSSFACLISLCSVRVVICPLHAPTNGCQNNLIESASHATGSLLIWDTGEYEVLPYREPTKTRSTDDELSDIDQEHTDSSTTDSEKLFAGFRERHLRLRLHGRRLPPGYTIGLRLPSSNEGNGQPKKPRHKRRRTGPSKMARTEPRSSDSEGERDQQETTPSADAQTQTEDGEEAALASGAEDEDDIIRTNNAYTGATNTIGSIHQRHWFLSLDRKNSGFRKARSGPDEGRWTGGWDPFDVMGRDHERSVVTGRSADEVMEDEGVKKFVGRKMWRPITE